MTTEHRIGSSKSTWDENAPCVGVSKFIVYEWNGDQIITEHSVETHVIFDDVTKTWSTKIVNNRTAKFPKTK